jgi:hypothetical protein
MAFVYLIENNYFSNCGKGLLIQWSNPAKNCRRAVAGWAAGHGGRGLFNVPAKNIQKNMTLFPCLNMKFRAI